MKKINLDISSTSYLFDNHNIWNDIKKEYKLNFNDYGKLSSQNLNKIRNKIEVIFFLLIDVIDYPNNKINQKIIDNILNLIEQKIISNQEVLFFYSKWYPKNYIRNIKTEDNIKKHFTSLETKINILKKKFTNFYVIDLDETFSNHGFLQIFDNRNWYVARCRFSELGLKKIVNSLSEVIFKIKHPSKKVLVLDCDNTLWGGIIGEDGIENIKLGTDGVGKIFSDFQKTILKIKKQGILLVLASKNNETDVIDVFKNHKSMILKINDITAYKINWRSKTINIKELANELGLGLDSFVFWDDNPIERAKMIKEIPEVTTIEVGEDIHEWPSKLEALNFFVNLKPSKEDENKTLQYKKRFEFISEKKISKNEKDYLKSIKLNPKIIKIDKSNISRASQLTLKTNQFNLRTVRYSLSEMKKIISNRENFSFLVSLQDLYGDHGNIGLIILRRINSKTYFLDTFILSCRILGRHLETWIIKKLFDLIEKKQIISLVAEYIPTKKNIVSKDVFKNHGFKKISKSEIKKLNKNTNIPRLANGNNSILYFCNKKTLKLDNIDIYEKN